MAEKAVINELESCFCREFVARKPERSRKDLSAMMECNRILVTGDILRPAEATKSGAPASSQKGNIRWLHTLIKRSLSRAVRMPIDMVQWGEGFDTELFYNFNEEEISIEGWGRLYDCKNPTMDSAMLAAAAFQNAFVIGFELPKILKNILSTFNIYWLDFSIHPIRCLDDLFLCCATNHDGIRRSLAELEHSLEPHEANVYALQAMYLRRPWPDVPRADTLLVGQVEYDSSVLLSGAFTNISTYVNQNPIWAKDITAWRDILFKPHPIQNYESGIYNMGIPFRYIHTTTANIYQLLSMPWLRRIVTVSSSVGVEAKLFDKEVVWLKGPFTSLNLPGTHKTSDTYFAVREEILWPPFWAELFSSALPVYRFDHPRPQLAPNAFRLSLNQAWGYPLTQMAASQQG